MPREIQSAMQSPRANPLTYPGDRPSRSTFVLEDAEWEIEEADKPVGDRRIVNGPVARVRDLLADLDIDQMYDRVPVIAIGSNSCPAQLRHKSHQQRFPLGIPMVRARVRGIRVTHSSFASMLGYIPATIALQDNYEDEVFVTFLNNHQLMEMDNSESRYRRLMLSSRDGFRIDCSGYALPVAYVYMSEGGYLSRPDDESRQPIPLTSQGELFESIRETAPELAELMGESPEEAVARARSGSRGWRQRFEDALSDAGWIAGESQGQSLECHKDRQPVYLGLSDSVMRLSDGVVA